MALLALVLGLVVLGAAAVRFGHDSRDSIRSPEQDLQLHGVTWTDLELGQAVPAGKDGRAAYPTLGFIERALDVPSGALRADPDAARLEARARRMTAECWSDAVWTTGVVPEAAFRQVLAELAPALQEAPVLSVERPVPLVEPTAAVRPQPAATPLPQTGGLEVSPATG